MTHHAKVTAGGKIVIPAELRREFGIKDGDSLIIERDADGHIVLKTFAQVVKRIERDAQAARATRRDRAEAPAARLREAMRGYSVDRFLTERATDWGE